MINYGIYGLKNFEIVVNIIVFLILNFYFVLLIDIIFNLVLLCFINLIGK